MKIFIITFKIWQTKESREFILKNIHETRNYSIEEINRNKVIRKKHKSVFKTLSYIEYFHMLASTLLDVFPFLFLRL